MNIKINTSTNPDSRKEWIISVEVSEPAYIRLRLIPDKLIGEHSSLKNTIKKILTQTWPTPEHMVLRIIEDVNNELVPKWLEVIYEHKGITIKIEDRQPGLKDITLPKNRT